MSPKPFLNMENASLLLLACLVDQRFVNVGNDTSTSNGSLQGMKRPYTTKS